MLLSLAAPPLAILLPNPLPPSTPPSAQAASKYPFASLRKSLRLLTDDSAEAPEAENDISFVYPGYAPISVRLVQCVAQKGGVLSNPADKAAEAPDGGAQSTVSGQVQAHPIVGWKGFDDVVATIPGETFDIVPRGQKGQGPKGVPTTSVGGLGERLHTYSFALGLTNALYYQVSSREQDTTAMIFFLGGCTYTELAALRWVARQHRGEFRHLQASELPLTICQGRKFLIATTGMISGASLIESIAGTKRSVAGEAGI